MSDYRYDVFLSYSRSGSALKWMNNHFYPKLLDCLVDQVAPAPSVFLDTSMHRALDWPLEIEDALRRSKILVAVLTPPYFESRWCMAEWRSMCARERMLGLASPTSPQGLIYPILYSDSDNFPDEARRRAWRDFKHLSTPEPVFQESRDWVHFHREVTDVAVDIVRLLKQVPSWRSNWPVERPDPVIIPPPKMPRFA